MNKSWRCNVEVAWKNIDLDNRPRWEIERVETLHGDSKEALYDSLKAFTKLEKRDDTSLIYSDIFVVIHEEDFDIEELNKQ